MLFLEYIQSHSFNLDCCGSGFNVCLYVWFQVCLTSKYKQYYTIYFLVCVSIYSLCPNSGSLCGEITQKIIILDGGRILCVCKFVERVSAPRLSGLFSPRFYSQTLEGYKLPFCFLFGVEFVVFIYHFLNTQSVQSFIINA